MDTKITREILKQADAQLDNIADFIFSHSQKNIHQAGMGDTGFMAKSGNVNRRWLEKEVVYTAPYAAFVEFGTNPHHPPVDPLVKWAKKKLGLGEKRARQAAWGIAKKIAREGSQPNPFLRPAVELAITRFSR